MDLGGFINMEETEKKRRNTKLDWRALLVRYRAMRDKHQARFEKERAAIEKLDKAIEETERLALHNIMTTYEMTPEKLEETLKNRQHLSLVVQGSGNWQNDTADNPATASDKDGALYMDGSLSSDASAEPVYERTRFPDLVSDKGKETFADNANHAVEEETEVNHEEMDE